MLCHIIDECIHSLSFLAHAIVLKVLADISQVQLLKILGSTRIDERVRTRHADAVLVVCWTTPIVNSAISLQITRTPGRKQARHMDPS